MINRNKNKKRNDKSSEGRLLKMKKQGKKG
jgi:hypothetical protein